MSLIIRKPIPTDHEILKYIFFVTRKNTFIPKAEEYFRINDYESAIEGEELWVAEHNQIIVGFVSMLLDSNFIHSLFVHAGWHRLGIGTALLKKAESILNYPIELKVRLENIKACKFYKKNGWIEVEVNKDPTEQYYLYRKYQS